MSVLCSIAVDMAFFYALDIFTGGGYTCSITAVHPDVPSVLKKMVSVPYLLKRLLYWIHIFTQVYNHKI